MLESLLEMLKVPFNITDNNVHPLYRSLVGVTNKRLGLENTAVNFSRNIGYSLINGPMGSTNHNKDYSEYSVELNPNNPLITLAITTVHELRHVHQFVTNRLRDDGVMDTGEFVWDGSKYNIRTLPYDERGPEIDAKNWTYNNFISIADEAGLIVKPELLPVLHDINYLHNDMFLSEPNFDAGFLSIKFSNAIRRWIEETDQLYVWLP
jgi:hypothetical protein